MTLEEQIYYSCAAYSTIQPNRAAVLNHLFCVIGNGYVWKDGALVETCGDTHYKNGKPMTVNAAINNVFRRRRKMNHLLDLEKRRWKREHKLHPVIKDEKLDKIIEEALAATKAEKEADPIGFEKKIKEQQAEWAKQKKKWRQDKRWEYCIPVDIDKRIKDTEFSRWYPMCQYSAMVTFPDDIQDEWLEGVIETAKLVLANPPKVDQDNPEKRRKETLRIARTSLSRAEAIKELRASAWIDMHKAGETTA